MSNFKSDFFDQNSYFISCDNEAPVQEESPWKKPFPAEHKKEFLSPSDGLVYFKKEFELPARALRSASVKASALGIFDLWINGKRVGRTEQDGTVVFDELKPGWTDYRKHVFFLEYDIKDYLKGQNAVTAAVSKGWYSGGISFGTYGNRPVKFLCEITLTYENGETERFGTDSTWRTAVTGPVLNADLWDGEYYDARLYNPSCYQYTNRDDGWSPAVISADPPIEVVEHLCPPARVRKDLTRAPVHTVQFTKIQDNGTKFGAIDIDFECVGEKPRLPQKAGQKTVFDFGQNLVGWPKITVKGKAGTRLDFIFGEMLNDSGEIDRGNDDAKGSVYSSNYRAGKSKATYILRGEEAGETYAPKFTFFGYRYLQLHTDGDVQILSVVSEVVTTDNREVSHIETSDPDINQLISNVIWGQRGNYLYVPTDCPQRNERLGWTGDTQVFINAGAYNADVRSFFHKWMMDVRDSQSENGSLPVVIPFLKELGHSAGAWSEAGIIVPYAIYKMYGDKTILEENYGMMQRYMDFLQSTGNAGAERRYGDWLSYEGHILEAVSCAYYAYAAQLMGKISAILEKREEKEKYDAVYARVKRHFLSQFYDENNRLLQGTQTMHLMALKFDLIPDGCHEAVKDALVRKIAENGYKLGTGFVGTAMLNEVLSDVGHSDLAYSLLLQTENPSWLFSVKQGATTIWERWNSYTIQSGFGDVRMNSFNHYAYGAILDWMFRYMAGIEADIDRPGFRHILLRPTPDFRKDSEIPAGQNRITWVKAHYDCAYGRIRSAWEIKDGRFCYEAEIPSGTTATLFFPLKEGRDTLDINGETVKTNLFEIKNGTAVIPLREGKYKVQ